MDGRVSPISLCRTSSRWSAKLVCCVVDDGCSASNTQYRKGQGGRGGGEGRGRGRGREKSEKKRAARNIEDLRSALRARAREPSAIYFRVARRADSEGDRINYYYNEFHITIGVVKLRMVRVDPGSWVVHVQHGVRLASALRAVAQG